MRRLIDVGAALAYAGLIFFLSAQSTFPAFTAGIWTYDKLIHGAEYAVFAVLVARALTPGGRSGRATALAVLLAALYGVSDELHQWYVPGRNASVWDAVADAVGAALGGLAAQLYSRHKSAVGRATKQRSSLEQESP